MSYAPAPGSASRIQCESMSPVTSGRGRPVTGLVAALNYGVTYSNTVDRRGQENQFRKNPTCPEDGVFPGKTYCDTIIR